jgi:hypothetical protein
MKTKKDHAAGWSTRADEGDWEELPSVDTFFLIIDQHTNRKLHAGNCYIPHTIP